MARKRRLDQPVIVERLKAGGVSDEPAFRELYDRIKPFGSFGRQLDFLEGSFVRSSLRQRSRLRVCRGAGIEPDAVLVIPEVVKHLESPIVCVDASYALQAPYDFLELGRPRVSILTNAIGQEIGHGSDGDFILATAFVQISDLDNSLPVRHVLLPFFFLLRISRLYDSADITTNGRPINTTEKAVLNRVLDKRPKPRTGQVRSKSFCTF